MIEFVSLKGSLWLVLTPEDADVPEVPLDTLMGGMLFPKMFDRGSGLG